MIWPGRRRRPEPSKLLAESRASRDDLAAVVDQLQHYVDDLREVTAELREVTAEQSRGQSNSGGPDE